MLHINFESTFLKLIFALFIFLDLKLCPSFIPTLACAAHKLCKDTVNMNIVNYVCGGLNRKCLNVFEIDDDICM